MTTFDTSSPAQGHQALGDIDSIRNNCLAARDNEASAEASTPSNPAAGQFWWTSDTYKTYQRTNSGSWHLLWSESDWPASSSALTSHTGANITNSATVHGIRQGAGNGFDADKLDGNEGSYYLAATHATATSGTHGVAGNIVGTTDTQALSNKTFGSGNQLTSDLACSAGVKVDGRDLSVDGGKLDTYPGAGAPATGTVGEDNIDWPAAGGISQHTILSSEFTYTGGIVFTTVETVKVYVPAAANSLEYMVRAHRTPASGSGNVRLKTDTNNGTDLTVSNDTYTWQAVGTLNVSDKSGWTSIDIQLHPSIAQDTAYLNYVAVRFK